MVCRASRTVFGACILALAVSACGSTSHAASKHRSKASTAKRPSATSSHKTASTTAQPTSTSSTSSTAQQVTTTATTPSAPSDLAFTYTSPTGWSYAGTLPIPNYTWSFSTDISSSPPGQAQIAYKMTGNEPTTTATGIRDNNPGRSDGPTLGAFVYVYYRLSNANASNWPGDPIVCSVVQSGPPFPNALVCEPPISSGETGEMTGNAAASGTTTAIPQSQAQALVAQLSADNPMYLISFTDIEGTCSFEFTPATGQLTEESNWTTHECGTASMTLE
jgi:hypothetical protein